VIHLVGPVVLAAALAGTGVYGLLARRNAVLVLIGAELILNAANVLLVTANALPAGGLTALRNGSGSAGASAGAGGFGAAVDPLLPGQVMTVFVITIAAAEIGLALAVILLLYRRRETSDLGAVRELGEASATFSLPPDAGEWPAQAASSEWASTATDGESSADGAGPGSPLADGAGQAGDAARVPGQRSEVRQQ
jgi:NADH-quinone oxidoreductase subunit K